MPRLTGSALAVTIAAIAVGVLAGCTGTGAHTSAPAPSSAATTPAPATATATAGATATSGATSTAPASAPATDPTSAGEAAYQPVAPGTIVAVGDLRGTNGGTSGHVAVKNIVGDKYEVIISGYRTSLVGDRAAAFAATSTPTPDQCVEGTDSIGVGTVVPNIDQTIVAYLPPEKTGGDPSNLKSFSISSSTGDYTGCGPAISAHATLTWSFPHPYTSIAVFDGGAGVGAEGAVTKVDGVPTSYTVASGDTMAAVLSRFGLTIAQLQFLNPGSFQAGEQSVPLEGYTWNLALADR